MLKPENYADVQKAMEDKLLIPHSNDIVESISMATEKIVANRADRYIINAITDNNDIANFRKFVTDDTVYEICMRCGLNTDGMDTVVLNNTFDNNYTKMSESINRAVNSMTSLIMQSIENNVEKSDRRINNERLNENGNITAESNKRIGADAPDTNRGRSDNGNVNDRTGRMGQSETLSDGHTRTLYNAESGIAGQNSQDAGVNAGGISKRQVRIYENGLSEKTYAEAAQQLNGKRNAEQSLSTGAGERGNRYQGNDTQSGNAGHGLDRSGESRELHTDESVIRQLSDGSRGRNNENLDIHRAGRNNEIIGNTIFKYISDKKYVKGNTDAMLKVAERLNAENISFSGRINNDFTTITISGNENQNKVRAYLAEEIAEEEQAVNVDKSNDTSAFSFYGDVYEHLKDIDAEIITDISEINNNNSIQENKTIVGIPKYNFNVDLKDKKIILSKESLTDEYVHNISFSINNNGGIDRYECTPSNIYDMPYGNTSTIDEVIEEISDFIENSKENYEMTVYSENNDGTRQFFSITDLQFKDSDSYNADVIANIYMNKRVPELIQLMYASDEMEDVENGINTDIAADREAIVRKILGYSTSVSVYELDGMNSEKTSAFSSPQIIFKPFDDGVEFSYGDDIVKYDWNEMTQFCISAVENYVSEEEKYILSRLKNHITDKKIDISFENKLSIQLAKEEHKVDFIYNKEKESYYQYSNDDKEGFPIPNLMNIEMYLTDGYSIAFETDKMKYPDVMLKKEEFIKAVTEDLCKNSYYKKIIDDDAKLLHTVRTDVISYLDDLVRQKTKIADYSLVQLESFFNEFYNSENERESIYRVVSQNVEIAIKQQPQLDNSDTYKIYQIKDGEKYRHLRFENMNYLNQHGLTPNEENYDLVYEGKLSDIYKYAETPDFRESYLDVIYTTFNVNTYPVDFHGHSLSVSDVIVLSVDSAETAHYIDTFGFKGVDEFLVKNQHQVIDSPVGNEIENFVPMPDESISIEHMHSYGYTWEEALPMDAEKAKELYRQNELIYKIYSDNTETEVESIDDFAEHDEKGGLFAIQRDVWNHYYVMSCPEYAQLLADLQSDSNVNNIVKANGSDTKTNFVASVTGKLEAYNNAFSKFMLAEKNNDTQLWESVNNTLIGKCVESIQKNTPEIVPNGELSEGNITLPFKVNDIIEFEGRNMRVENINFERDSVEMIDLDMKGWFPIARIVPISSSEMQQYIEKFRTTQSEQTEEQISFSDIPETVVTKSNYHINNEHFNEDGGAKTRFRNNVEAIKLLNVLETENRLATSDEQEVLARYVGWGGIPQAFDNTKLDWTNEYNELRSLLNDNEYRSARESTMNAHYTSPTVISAIYQGLENLGFNGGNILEPAMGTGNFFGAMPDSLVNNSKLYGVELDSITGRIARQLYQTADVNITGYENTDFPDNLFDVVIGNVPFGAYKLADKRYDKENFFIHDYFFAKSLDKVKPGGVVAFVTSKGTMDKNNSDVRKYLAERAELLGAIRLPNNAFKANAGTEVTTDIVFLQKRERPIDITNNEPDWVHKGIDGNGIELNSYFIKHPEMILGKMVEGNKLYGNQQDSTMCIPIEGMNLKEQLLAAVSNINGKISNEKTIVSEKENSDTIPAPPNVDIYRYAVVNDKVYYHADGATMIRVNKPTLEARTKAMVSMRDTLQNLLDAELNNTDNCNEIEIVALREKLNLQYDAFAEKFGRITDKKNKSAFINDNSYHLVASLERYDSNNKYIGKADVFEKNTIKPKIVSKHVDNATDALILSISERAMVDFDYMQQLTDMDKDTLIEKLGNKIYQIPLSDKWVTDDEYLTGNIRKKLEDAKAAGMERNIEALEAAMPPMVDAADIDAKLGAAWIPTDYVRQFVIELLDPPYRTREKINVSYSPFTDKWKLEGWKSSYHNSNVTEIFGLPEYNAYEIIEQSLNMKPVEVYKDLLDAEGKPVLDKKGDKMRVLDKEKTTIVQSRQKEIKKQFNEWAFKDPDRRNDLVNIFNEKFNSVRLREFDGSHLNFVGINPEIILRPHQVNAVARQLYNGNTLLAHEVGAGKTFEMIAAAMEGKRLGLHSKSMFAVPNHLTEQFANDFRTLYPNCNILVAGDKDMDSKHRRDFMARIATGDYDAIIMGHSSFDRIHLSPEREMEYIQDELEMLRSALMEAKVESQMQGNKKSFSVKQIELSIKNKETALEKTKARVGNDNVICFERLGIDKLFVDESHTYKNLDISTKMTRVAGLGGKGAGRSLAMLMKCKYLNEKTDYHGVTFASGTPVSNSMTELYTIMRYLEPNKMATAGIRSFDNWASVFAETEQSNELKPECDGKFQTKTRISKYSCFEQLMTMFGEVADIKTADMMDLKRPDAEIEVIKAPASKEILREMRKLSARATEIRKGNVDSTKDNMLKLTMDGKKIGLDLRLANPFAKDDPNSKVNLCVNKVLDVYQETSAISGVQMIFCDMSTPKKDNPNSYAIYKQDPTGEYQLAYKSKLSKNDTVESIHQKFSNGRSLPKDYNRDDYGLIEPDDVIVLHTTDEIGNVTNTAHIINAEKMIDLADIDVYNNIGINQYVSAEEIAKRFCVYDDIKDKLVKGGIPIDEIAYIHDYEKAEDKRQLYQKMNEGKIRVMLGSTGKCGAGMNAQKKMVALHHLDVPPRPSDIEQRNGRILRQGNDNKNVKIYRYITDRTFDAYSYQILENKQKFISQIMSGKAKVKTCEDIDEKALDYAEVKALCAGNPLIKEKIDLETEVNNLKILKAAFDRQRFNLQDKALKTLPREIESVETESSHIKNDIDTIKRQQPLIDDNGKEYYPIIINDIEYRNKEEAGIALKAVMLSTVDGKEVKCGEYRGFKVSVLYDTFENVFKAKLVGEGRYYCALNSDPNVNASGNIRRLDNVLNGGLEKLLGDEITKLEQLKSNLEVAKKAASEEFPQLDELHRLENRLAEVEKQLNSSETNDLSLNLDIYDQMQELFPTIMSGEDSYIKLESGDAFDSLNVQWISEKEIAVSHTYEQNGDLMRDPEIVFRIDSEKQSATAISFENSSMNKYEVFDNSEAGQMMQADCNNFAIDWFDNIAEQGYEVIEHRPLDEPEQDELVADGYER